MTLRACPRRSAPPPPRSRRHSHRPRATAIRAAATFLPSLPVAPADTRKTPAYYTTYEIRQWLSSKRGARVTCRQNATRSRVRRICRRFPLLLLCPKAGEEKQRSQTNTKVSTSLSHRPLGFLPKKTTSVVHPIAPAAGFGCLVASSSVGGGVGLAESLAQSRQADNRAVPAGANELEALEAARPGVL